MKKDLYKKYRDKGWSHGEIAKKFGVTHQAVAGLLKHKYKRPIAYCKICSGLITGYKRYSYCQEHTYLAEVDGRDFLRELVRIRDKHVCQECGKIWEKGRKLDVHHTDEELENNRTYQASKDMENMVTLCHKCHMNLPQVKEKRSLGRVGITRGLDTVIA